MLKIKNLKKALGPGVVAGAADDDPSGIGTYTIAGAQFGMMFLWTAFLTWPLMAFVQMACARVGLATGAGLAAALRKKIPRPLLMIVCLFLFLANTLNIGADLVAMAECSEMLTGISSHFFVVVFGVGIAWATVILHYSQISRVLKWLALFLFAYVATAFIAKPDWSAVLAVTFRPELPKESSQWATLVAILGTTISPYLFFWQASQEVEEEKAAGTHKLKERMDDFSSALSRRKIDVGIGTFFSNLVMYFIILASALTLHHGNIAVESSRAAAEALVPTAGRFASLLYTFGLLGVGFLSIPTLTGSAAYALAETFGWRQGLDVKWVKAKAFYAVIMVSTLFGIAFDFMHMNPMKALYWSAVGNGLLAPFLLVGILLVISDSKIMQSHPSSKLGQIVIAATTFLMFAAAIGMFIF